MGTSAEHAVNTSERADRLLLGAIDPHVHSGPSIAQRSIDHLELARDASIAGMAAIVTKDHDYSGVVSALMINKHASLSTKVFSGISLNNVVGGLNPYAVEHTAALGGKIVWLPTLSAANHFRWEQENKSVHPASTDKIRPASTIRILDNTGNIEDNLKEIMDIVAMKDMAMASGHIHVSETWLIFQEAIRRGVKKLVFTHPEIIVDASLEDVRSISSLGATVEHSLSAFLPGTGLQVCETEELRAQIDAAGVDKTMMCSDLGQLGSINPVEGIRRGINCCINFGYSDDEIRQLFSSNAAKILGIEIFK